MSNLYLVTLTFKKTYAPLMSRTLVKTIIVDAINSHYMELMAREYAKKSYKNLELIGIRGRALQFINDIAVL
jgi:hypothetical protein